MTSYQVDLFLAWLFRVVLWTTLLAIAAMCVGCGHTLNTTSTGTLTREPAVITQPTN